MTEQPQDDPPHGATPPPPTPEPPPAHAYGMPAASFGPQDPSAAQTTGYSQPGAPTPSAASGQPVGYSTAGTPLSVSDERLWAMLAHLSPFVAAFVGLPFLGPLVIYLLYRDRSPFVRSQSLEALNFQITLAIGYVISVVLIFLLIGIPMLVVLGIVSIVFQIIAAIAANRGEDYRYPFALRLVS